MKAIEREETIAGLVAEYLERVDAGEEDVSFFEICVNYPELQEAVERGVARALDIPRIQAAGHSRDRRVGSVLINRYQIDGRLGAGAMGVVYHATDLDLAREVAIKVVHAGLMEREQVLARFEREAAALAAMQHPNVVTIYDRGVADDGVPFLVMELIDGVSCATIVEQAERERPKDDASWLSETFQLEPLPERSLLRQVIQWAADLASGLQAAHDQSVHHRDVKPSNVMIRRDGRAVLLDFGIAAMDDQASLTHTNAAVGTPAYMAPEALSGRIDAFPSQDVYGLAATLYHLLTFSPPYPGSPSQVLTALATREPVPAESIRPGLPRDAQAILDHGLARNPSARYPSAKAMESDLRALLRFEPVSVSPTKAWVRTARKIRRSKVALSIAGTLLAVGLVMGGNSWSIAREKSKVKSFQSSWDGLPVNMGFVRPANRVIHLESAKAEVEAHLDALVELGRELIPALTLRAVFRFDHGDRVGAAEDIGRIVRLAPSDYTRSLSSAYAAAAEGNGAVSLDSLPEPVAPNDLYLAGYHAIRTGDLDGAELRLRHADVAPYRHAKEILLVLELVKVGKIGPEDIDELDRAANQLLVACQELERDSGHVSSTTAYVAGTALSRQRKLPAAYGLMREAAVDSPGSVVVMKNAGKIAYELGHYEEAREFLLAGLELAPQYTDLVETLARCEAKLGRLDRAVELCTHSSLKTARGWSSRRWLLRASVEIIEAERLRSAGEGGERVHAQRVLEALERYSGKAPTADRLKRYAQALLSEDTRALFSAALETLIDSPESYLNIALLESLWPESLVEGEEALILAWAKALTSRIRLRERRQFIPNPQSVSDGGAR